MKKPYSYHELQAVRRSHPDLAIREQPDVVRVSSEGLRPHFHIIIWNDSLCCTVIASGYESIHIDRTHHDTLASAVGHAAGICHQMEKGTFRPNVDSWPKGYYRRWLDARKRR